MWIQNTSSRIIKVKNTQIDLEEFLVSSLGWIYKQVWILCNFEVLEKYVLFEIFDST